MLNIFSDVPGHSGDPHARNACWIDLLRPTPDEVAQLMAEYSVIVPSREALQETSERVGP